MVAPTISAHENASDSDDERMNWFSPWFKDKPSLEPLATPASFVGQYGGLTQDIPSALSPYLTDGGIDIKGIPEGDGEKIIRLVRSKLMP